MQNDRSFFLLAFESTDLYTYRRDNARVDCTLDITMSKLGCHRRNQVTLCAKLEHQISSEAASQIRCKQASLDIDLTTFNNSTFFGLVMHTFQCQVRTDLILPTTTQRHSQNPTPFVTAATMLARLACYLGLRPSNWCLTAPEIRLQARTMLPAHFSTTNFGLLRHIRWHGICLQIAFFLLFVSLIAVTMGKIAFNICGCLQVCQPVCLRALC